MKVDRCMGTRQASPTKAWSCTGKIDNHKWLACSTRINSKIWAKCHVSLFYEWELGPNPPIKMNITTSKHQICLSLMIHILATETALWPCFFVHVSLMRKTLMARQPTCTISSEPNASYIVRTNTLHLGCVSWDHVSGKHNSPLNTRFFVYGKHSSCALLSFWQATTISLEVFELQPLSLETDHHLVA